jgi:hypothetical protein
VASEQVTVNIQADGTVEFVYTDALQPLVASGAATVRRVSHVEPDGQGGWTADMSPVGGPVLGPFVLREAALQIERMWLKDHHGI